MRLSLALLQKIAIASITATMIIAAAGIGKLRLNSHYTAYFDSSDPLLVSHDEISDLYSRNDGIFVALRSTHSFLTAEHYELVERLAAVLQMQPHSSRVISMTELGIVSEDIVADDLAIPSLQQLKDDGRVIGLLLSDDLRTAGIGVQFALPDSHSRTILETVDAVRDSVYSEIGGLDVSAHFSGTLALNEAYIRVVQHDARLIVPALLLTSILLLAFLMRSKRAVMTMLPVAVLSVAAAFGFAGLLNAELAAISTFTPVIIFSISVAGCVHMANTFVHYRDTGRDANDAAIATVKYNMLPMLLANGTTALGFLGLALSPSPPVQVVGYLVAAGIACSFLLCMTLLPSLLARFDPWVLSSISHESSWNRLGRIITHWRRTIIIVFLLLALPASWFASQNVISDNVFGYFPDSHSFTQDTKLVDAELSGVNEVLFSVDTNSVQGLLEEDAINAIDRFSVWLRQQPEVRRVISIADVEAVQEARTEGRLQQRLNFYKKQLDGREQNPLLRFAVSDDYSSALVAAYLHPQDSAALTRFDRNVQVWAAKNLDDFTLQSGGPTLMFAHLGEQNIRSMVIAFSAALVVAALIFGLVFRSARLAWIGVVCNLLPVLYVFSIWALVSGQISIGAAVVLGMVLGIVLDDTVYLLSSYQTGKKSNNDDSIQLALIRVGPALIATSVALICGLSMGLLSGFGPIWSMSALSVTIIAAALVVDLLLLPAMVAPHPPKMVLT